MKAARVSGQTVGPSLKTDDYANLTTPRGGSISVKIKWLH